MVRLTELAQQLVSKSVHSGELVIDATAGNGLDTLFLARLVGPAGRVIACDIQPTAIQSAKQKITAAGMDNVEFLLVDHANLFQELNSNESGRVAGVMFNLGYLPGGDKSVITTKASTVTAVSLAVDLLRADGILTVLAYIGHPGGQEEAQAVEAELQVHIAAGELHVSAWPESALESNIPRLYAVQRLPTND